MTDKNQPKADKSPIKKTIKKTVNLTGKEQEKTSLVLKDRPEADRERKLSKKDIAKANEKLVEAKKEAEVKEVKKANPSTHLASLELRRARKAKKTKSYKLSIDVKDMLKAGCHLGHKQAKTNPKAKENIYGVKNGVTVFDLFKSIDYLQKACDFLHSQAKMGKKIILVGTKRQAREAVKRVAEETGMPYVTARWLGGTVSNWDQIRKNIDRLNDLRQGMEENRFSDYTKKERSMMKKDISRLERMVGGMAKLDKIFDVIFVVDAGFEKTAIREAKFKQIPVVAMVDSDTDPAIVDYPIPINDDNVKSVSLIVEEIGKAIK